MIRSAGRKLLRVVTPGASRIAGPQPVGQKVPPWVDKATDPPPEPMPLANCNYRPGRIIYRHEMMGFGDDTRLKYLALYVDVRGCRVLELGPLGGLWTFILDKMGAKEIVAVEARPENLVNCEEAKQVYGLGSATFVQQDIERLCQGEEAPKFEGGFDLVFAAGILYHLADPAAALAWCRRQAPALFLATQYFEPAAPGLYPKGMFERVDYKTSAGSFEALAYREPEGPWSGTTPRSIWLQENDLLTLVGAAGYTEVHLAGRDLHFGMPSLVVCAWDRP